MRRCGPEQGPGGRTMRKFLVVLDDSKECLNATRFAALRAASTGGRCRCCR